MYTIVERINKNIVTFIADADDDMKEIKKLKDVCGPGSKVTVLDKAVEGASKVHTFIMTPSEKWVLYEGDSEYDPESPG